MLRLSEELARRTLYNQFASKEEILREMLSRVPTQVGASYPLEFRPKGMSRTCCA